MRSFEQELSRYASGNFASVISWRVAPWFAVRVERQCRSKVGGACQKGIEAGAKEHTAAISANGVLDSFNNGHGESRELSQNVRPREVEGWCRRRNGTACMTKQRAAQS